MGADIAQRPCQQRAGPLRKPFGRGLVQLHQQAFTGRVIIDGNPAGPEIIRQSRQPFLIKTHAPFADARGPGVQPLVKGLVGEAGGRLEDDPRPFHITGLGLRLVDPAFQLGAFGLGELNRGCRASLAPNISCYVSLCK